MSELLPAFSPAAPTAPVPHKKLGALDLGRQLRVYCRKHAPKDRPPNFSVCPELAATPQLLAQVMTGSRALLART